MLQNHLAKYKSNFEIDYSAFIQTVKYDEKFTINGNVIAVGVQGFNPPLRFNKCT